MLYTVRFQLSVDNINVGPLIAGVVFTYSCGYDKTRAVVGLPPSF